MSNKLNSKIETFSSEQGINRHVKNGPWGGGSHMKHAGMFVVLLRSVNFGFWSRLGCSRHLMPIFSHQGLAKCCTRRNIATYFSTIAPYYHIRSKERAKYDTLLHCRTGQKYEWKAEHQNGRTKRPKFSGEKMWNNKSLISAMV